MKPNIESIHAREILDSRGNPTIAAAVVLTDGTIGCASVPSGASTGIHEAFELRDGNPKRYRGMGVLKAVKHVNETIAHTLVGMDVRDQQAIDTKMCQLDGTQNKKRLGANAILGVSLASARAAAKATHKSLYTYLRETFAFPFDTFQLPIPTMNVLNGGAHAAWVLDFQEYMIVPMQKKIRERVRVGAEIFYALGQRIQQKGFSTLKGDEGGYAIALKKNRHGLDVISEAIHDAGYEAGKDVYLAIDPAMSELYDAKSHRYVLRIDQKKLTGAELMRLWKSLVETYPLISLEDALHQDAWEDWAALTATLPDRVSLVGDDFFVTNKERLQKGIELGAGNAILIKLNQIGTLTETMETIALAKKHGYKISVSHRSGETADTFIADLAVAVNADFIKAGSLSRSERLEKYNRLMEIEEELEYERS